MKRATPWFLVAVLALVLVVEEWRLRRPGAPSAGTMRELDARESAPAGPREPALVAPEPEAPARREAVDSRAVSEEPSKSSATLAQQWLARYQEAPNDANHGHRVTEQLIAALAPDVASAVIHEIWKELTEVHRRSLLNPFVHRCHERVLEILELAARDPLFPVQQQGLRQLRSFAFRSFEEDYSAYLEWAERTRGLPPSQAIQESVVAFLSRLAGLAGPELRAELNGFSLPRAGEFCGLDALELLETHGALTLVQAWVLLDDSDIRRSAFRWVSMLRPGESWMRAHVLPLVEAEGVDGNVRAEALASLGHPDHRWAESYLLDLVRRTAALDPESYPTLGTNFAANALAGIGDPSAIPELIRILAAHGPANPSLNYDIGYFGLGFLTGVTYDESHDGSWWLDWWEKNRARFDGSAAR